MYKSRSSGCIVGRRWGASRARNQDCVLLSRVMKSWPWEWAFTRFVDDDDYCCRCSLLAARRPSDRPWISGAGGGGAGGTVQWCLRSSKFGAGCQTNSKGTRRTSWPPEREEEGMAALIAFHENPSTACSGSASSSYSHPRVVSFCRNPICEMHNVWAI